jgi:hypothetical protein
MKRLVTLLISTLLTAGSLLAVTTSTAHAATCTVSYGSRSFTATCSGGGQFRAWVHCRRTTSSTYAYYSYGPVRNSGGTSTATCSQSSNDYRDDQGVQFV